MVCRGKRKFKAKALKYTNGKRAIGSTNIVGLDFNPVYVASKYIEFQFEKIAIEFLTLIF